MKNRNYLARCVALVLSMSLAFFARAQNPTDSLPGDPGISISVTKVQNLCFGAFSIMGGGGTVTIGNNGARSATGGITLLGLSVPYYQAIFDVQAPEGWILNVDKGSAVNLSGPGGATASMLLGDCSPALPMTVSPYQTTISVNIGGTLTVSGSSPPGAYSGSFNITFYYE